MELVLNAIVARSKPEIDPKVGAISKKNRMALTV
jgi:hypothetical protein